MTATVDLTLVKEYLRIDHNNEDNSLQKLLDAAETYIRGLCVEYVDTDGAWDTLPDDLQTAVLLLTAHFYDHRTVFVSKQSVSELPFSISALIASYREYEGTDDE